MKSNKEINKLSDLLQIGLTEGEAKIYAALLEIGPSSVGPIRKRSKVSHSNIYEILDRLIEKGIVTTIIKNGVKTFQAVSPSNLFQYLEKKEKQIEKEKEILKKALPRIEALQETYPTQEAMMFVGLKGLRSAYEELYKDGSPSDENLWIYVHNEKYAKQSDKFYLHSWANIPKKIKSRGIVDKSYRKSKFAKEFSKKHELRFVDFPIFSHGEVYGNKFMLVSWEEDIITVLVHAKHASSHFKKYFESVWNAGKK
ncbi:TrmB family transcriptional regulator [Candidatus Woesearchaeota archaeon]|jgi:HTH-type transcriptional regulator, sugar sensing transcriptional regulator|nr:TrmB family transcriptional regulator [Candidatus Woesearchaeota archaeon]MBT6518646.1 TrmB family transcriptional regulator [Candidatus Woesearchaeota archaeon]MBT7368708.1 TrmB family transcriptional regulator [Candidatus Woesearchaeota archaeon]